MSASKQPPSTADTTERGPALLASRQQRRSATVWKNRIVVGILLVAFFVGGYFGYRHFAALGAKRPSAQPRRITVTVARAKAESWTHHLSGIGTLEAPQGVDVTNELDGKVTAIEFDSGQHVDQGDLLVQLDTSSERAELRSIEARLEQARTERERAKIVVRKNAITVEEYEQLATAAENLQAQAARQRAIIAKKRIVAPFDGVLGIRQIDLGAYLSPGTAIVTLQQIDPIFVNFDLPERHAAVVETGQSVSIAVSAFPDMSFAGRITAISPLIDEATRSFTVQATLPNREFRLRPGMFADVTVELSGSREVVTVPQTAITFNAYGESVFLVRNKGAKSPAQYSLQTTAGRSSSAATGTASAANFDGQESAHPPQTEASPDGELIARHAFVTTGERRGLRIEVTEGVTSGERVVTAGQMKLEDGSLINISHEDMSQDAPPRPTKP